MIIDRTLEDVMRAKELISKDEIWSEDDYLILERGIVTINTLNRIENKQQEIWQNINELGYKCPEIITKNWTHDDVFDMPNFERISQNLDLLKKSFFQYRNTPDIPQLIYHYSTFNSLEKILLDLENMGIDIVTNYRECGNYECGGNNI